MDDQKDAIRAVARPSPDANRQQSRNVIAIGGSAGALDALLDIVGAMPDAFSGNLFVVSLSHGAIYEIFRKLPAGRQ